MTARPVPPVELILLENVQAVARRRQPQQVGKRHRHLLDDRCVQERDLAPKTLHNWLMGELLFVVDVVNRCRLAGGSTDWVDACAPGVDLLGD